MNKEMYLKSYKNAIKKWQIVEDNAAMKKVVFWGLKFVSVAKDEVQESPDIMFDIISSITNTIKYVTPNEFMNLFPIDKDYDGHKYEMKDYYHTMDYIAKLESYEPIQEPFKFMMEYHNRTIRRVCVHYMMTMSRLRVNEGHIHPVEEFMASQGEETPNTFKNGKNEPMYIRNGKPTKVLSSKEPHLSLVK